MSHIRQRAAALDRKKAANIQLRFDHVPPSEIESHAGITPIEREALQHDLRKGNYLAAFCSLCIFHRLRATRSVTEALWFFIR